MKNLIFVFLLLPFLFAGTFQSYTEKNPAESSDLILILDNDDLTTKKVQVGNLPGGSVNWDSANIQGGGINWIDFGNEIQGRNINWTSLDQSIQKGNVNWNSLDNSVQASGVNWSSLNDSIQDGGINWDSTIFSIDSNGNVGIGTLAPRGRLTIFGGKLLLDSGSSIRMKRANGTPVDVFLDVADSDTSRLLLKQTNSGFDNRLDVTTSGGSIIASFMNQTSGKSNVGIGTSVPTGRLELMGNSSDYPLKVTSVAGATAGDLLVITSGGNVGLGSTTPNGALVVRTSASDIGWSKQSAANQACNTTCTASCVFGQNTADMSIVNCSDATADVCICAGSN